MTDNLSRFTPEQAKLAEATHGDVYEHLCDLIEKDRTPQGAEAILSGALAGVAQVAWMGKAREASMDDMVAWWTDLGRYYLTQMFAEDAMGAPQGGTQ